MKILLYLYVKGLNRRAGTSLRVRRGDDGVQVEGTIRTTTYVHLGGTFSSRLLLETLRIANGWAKSDQYQAITLYIGRDPSKFTRKIANLGTVLGGRRNRG